MHRLSIPLRMSLLALVAVIGVVAISLVAITTLRTTMEGERMASLRSVVQTFASQVAALEGPVARGEMTRDAAIQELRRLASIARYDGDNYFFAYDWEGTVLAQPVIPAQVGKNLLDQADSRGNYYRRTLIEAARVKGDGIAFYWFLRPGQTEPVRKAAYGKAIPGLKLIVASGVYVDDLDNAVESEALRMGAASLVVILVAGVIGLALGRSIVLPLRALEARLRRFPDGDVETSVPCCDRRDEIGHMANAIMVLRDHARERYQLQAQQVELKQSAEAERREAVGRAASAFEGSVANSLEQVRETAVAIKAAMEDLQQHASINDTASLGAANQANSVASNLETVSAAIVELAASVREISVQVQGANRVTDAASMRAAQTARQVETLVQRADKVDAVVQLINAIASQTNLLALNATIEAARAGEAGKGFAVVANEVKLLAGQAAKATEEIASQVRGIQTSTTAAADELGAIIKVIAEIRDISTSIAAAVEEQSAATAEIERALTTAASGATDLKGTVRSVADRTKAAGDLAEQVLVQTEELSERFHALDDRAVTFVRQLREAS